MNATLMSRPYWCISRQRSWGLPIPCFFSKKEPIINDDFISKSSFIENLRKK
jgi:isoleucyl-tRNA synthetase